MNFPFCLFRIFDLVASVNSGAIFSLLPINGVLLGLSMYTIENVSEMDSLLLNSKLFKKQFITSTGFNFQSDFILVVFFFDMLCAVCALMWCSLFCYFANMASDRLSSLGNTVFATNWYDYPVEWQKFVILMVERSQKPVYFKGLHLIKCTLEVFGTVSLT